MTSPEPTDRLDQIALYLTGAMSPEEREAFEAALRAGGAESEALVRDLERHQAVAEQLLAAVEPLTPDPRVRDRLGDSGQREGTPVDGSQASTGIWSEWPDAQPPSAKVGHELFTLAAAEGVWEETGVDGVLVRRLFVDRQANRMTAMFKMAPGATYVPHRHDGAEECYVLEGDLQVGDLQLRAGDYQRAPAGSHHGVQRTERGCLLLVNCSLSDEWED